jgi:hypothetical protein
MYEKSGLDAGLGPNEGQRPIRQMADAEAVARLVA